MNEEYKIPKSGGSLRNFLEIPYEELERLNLEAKEKRTNREKYDAAKLETEYRAYLEGEKRIKAVTVCFSDIEGKFHMLDYDKKFLLKSADNLTFDGSSVRGFSSVSESDLRLALDWGSFYWLPSDVFGPGKVVVFANILTRDGKIHPSDFRARLKKLAEDLYEQNKTVVNIANEIEGFLVDGVDAEQKFSEVTGFSPVTYGGYYYSSPLDKLRLFIDAAAEAQRAMGFSNEKDHPEVAPSQFELNYSYSDVLNAADQVQLYKLVSRQIAKNLGMTATFLPKPSMGINGSGMHTNVSMSKEGVNLFYDKDDVNGVSAKCYDFIDKLLASATDMSLVLNASVNAYRRLDPHFEAPNQIKFSPVDRTSMVRIPLGNEKSARLEVRSVGPDANPYLLFFTLIKVGMTGPKQEIDEDKRPRTRFLPGNVYDAIRAFRNSTVMESILGEETVLKYAELKQDTADRCPKELGTSVKRAEIIYHHEITNQYLWNQF